MRDTRFQICVRVGKERLYVYWHVTSQPDLYPPTLQREPWPYRERELMRVLHVSEPITRAADVRVEVYDENWGYPWWKRAKWRVRRVLHCLGLTWPD